MSQQQGAKRGRRPVRYRQNDLLPEEVQLRRLLAREQKRQFKAALSIHAAADKGRKNKDWRASSGSADLAIIPDSETLNARARQLVRDSWIGESIARAYSRNIVGKGIQITPHAKGEDGKPLIKLNKKAKSEFDFWAKTKEACDVEKKQTFAQKQQLSVTERATVGEHFIVWSYQAPLRRDGKVDLTQPVGLKLQSFEPEQLDLRILSFEGREVRGGIELDENGAAVAYHFYTRNPNDYLYRKAFWSKRVPRERVLHYYKQKRVLQTRGATALAPVMNDMRDYNRMREATLWRSVMESCIGLIIRKPYPTGISPNTPLSLPFPQNDQSGETQSGIRTFDMIPGMVGELLPGEDITSVGLSTANSNFTPFTENTVRGVGAGVGISFGQISRQSQGNYSVARQDMLEDRKEWEPEQELIIDDEIRPIYHLWYNFAVIEGRFDEVKEFDTDEFLKERRRYLEADYVPPPQTWIDPEKEANAFAILLKNRLITREEIVALRGQIFLNVVNKLASEKDVTDQLGLTLPEDAQERTELRDVLKALLADKTGAVSTAIANETDQPELLQRVGVPLRVTYKQPTIELPESNPTPPTPPPSQPQEVNPASAKLGWVTINGNHVLVGDDNDSSGDTSGGGNKAADSDRAKETTKENKPVDNHEWARSLSEQQQQALFQWTSEGYKEIRNFQSGKLKEGTRAYDRAKQHAENIQSALASAPKESGVFYRGMHDLSKPMADKLSAVGTEFSLNTFASFTESSRIARNFAKDGAKEKSFVIYKVKNGSGVNVSALSGEKEREILMDRGTKFKVVSRVEKTITRKSGFFDVPQRGYEVTLEQAA